MTPSRSPYSQRHLQSLQPHGPVVNFGGTPSMKSPSMKSNHISQTTTPLPNSKICGPPNCGPFRDIDKERLVPRHRGRINVKALHSGPALQYHFYVLLSLPWYQLFLLMAFSYIIFNFIFGGIFYWTEGLTHEDREDVLSYWTCFFFSIQTMDTIGYGALSPTSFKCDVAVMFCSVCANFYWCWFTGLVFAKLSLPKKLRHTLKWSNVAVMNRQQEMFVEDDNAYENLGFASLSFRVSDCYAKSELLDGDFHLVYFSSHTRPDGWEEYFFEELDFEINRQKGRNREMQLSTPLLALPWTVVHPIDENSPLRGKTLSDMKAERGEVIAVLEGIDEQMSCNYQGRWSFVPSEILEHHRFLPCVKRVPGEGYGVDFDRISLTESIDEPDMSTMARYSPQKTPLSVSQTPMKPLNEKIAGVDGEPGSEDFSRSGDELLEDKADQATSKTKLIL